VNLPLVLEPLRHRDFRLLWTGQTVSSLGNSFNFVAIPFQILALGGGAVELGLTAAIGSATTLVALLISGTIVDRVPRRTVILASDLASGCVVSIVALLGFAGALRIEHLYAASAIFGITFAFFFPAMTAIIPELVPPDILQAGNALRGLSRQLGRLGGPVLGGVIVAVAGPPVAFALDAASFFLSFAVLSFANPPRREPPARAALLDQVRAGFAFTFSLPWLWTTILLFALINVAFFGPLTVALPLLVRDVLLGDARLFGAIATAVGLGELAGTFVIAQRRVRRIGVVMYLWAILAGLSVAGYGLMPVVPVIFGSAFLVGLSLTGFGILWETAVQRNVPGDLLGRVSSVDFLGSTLLTPLGPIVFAALVETVGPATAFVVGGGVTALLCLSALAIRSIRDLE
jgi:MFS family permease